MQRLNSKFSAAQLGQFKIECLYSATLQFKEEQVKFQVQCRSVSHSTYRDLLQQRPEKASVGQRTTGSSPILKLFAQHLLNSLRFQSANGVPSDELKTQPRRCRGVVCLELIILTESHNVQSRNPPVCFPFVKHRFWQFPKRSGTTQIATKTESCPQLLEVKERLCLRPDGRLRPESIGCCWRKQSRAGRGGRSEAAPSDQFVDTATHSGLALPADQRPFLSKVQAHLCVITRTSINSTNIYIHRRAIPRRARRFVRQQAESSTLPRALATALPTAARTMTWNRGRKLHSVVFALRHGRGPQFLHELEEQDGERLVLGFFLVRWGPFLFWGALETRMSFFFGGTLHTRILFLQPVLVRRPDCSGFVGTEVEVQRACSRAGGYGRRTCPRARVVDLLPSLQRGALPPRTQRLSVSTSYQSAAMDALLFVPVQISSFLLSLLLFSPSLHSRHREHLEADGKRYTGNGPLTGSSRRANFLDTESQRASRAIKGQCGEHDVRGSLPVLMESGRAGVRAEDVGVLADVSHRCPRTIDWGSAAEGAGGDVYVWCICGGGWVDESPDGPFGDVGARGGRTSHGLRDPQPPPRLPRLLTVRQRGEGWRRTVIGRDYLTVFPQYQSTKKLPLLFR
ncbi:hypothetical protein C8R46DRAFT_1035096 [Mycena filopes]|nr:hypothetical protein C8R46DRAFT_1035096 [Mycena filopes]